MPGAGYVMAAAHLNQRACLHSAVCLSVRWESNVPVLSTLFLVLNEYFHMCYFLQRPKVLSALNHVSDLQQACSSHLEHQELPAAPIFWASCLLHLAPFSLPFPFPPISSHGSWARPLWTLPDVPVHNTFFSSIIKKQNKIARPLSYTQWSKVWCCHGLWPQHCGGRHRWIAMYVLSTEWVPGQWATEWGSDLSWERSDKNLSEEL